MKQCVYFVLYFLATHASSFAAQVNSIGKRIVLVDRYHYVIVGSDHVARSIGIFLASRYKSKSILVLQSNRCDQILEPVQHAPNGLGLQISDTFAECTHQMGYQFTDPLRHGQRVGIGYKNRTRNLDMELQTLWAIDPNLQLLSGATVHRLLYNHAASSMLGVELELDGSKQCIFAEEEVLFAGRCLNDYKHLSKGSIVPEVALESCLREIPLDVGLGSPVVVPIFHTKVSETMKQSPTLLGTELYLRTPNCEEEDGAKPNTRLRMVMGNANLDHHVWVGFVPSLIWDDSNYHPHHEETVKMLAYVLKTASAVTESDAFKRLNLTALDHHILECMKYVGSGQYWTCFLDVKLKRFNSLTTVGRHKSTLLDGDYRLKGVKSLRLLPFGLTAPFLDRLWRTLFHAEEKSFETSLMNNLTFKVNNAVKSVNSLTHLMDSFKSIPTNILAD